MIKASNDPQQILELKHYRSKFWSAWAQVRPQKIQNQSRYNYLKGRFFPKVIVNCKFGNCLQNGRSKSGKATINRSFNKLPGCNPFIADRILYLKRLTLKYKYNGSILYFGSCAEDDAANNILANIKNIKPSKLSDFSFTSAIRPRTGEERKYCAVCERVFG